MAKYINDRIVLRTETGKRYYNTLVPQTPRIEENPREYTTKAGDRWDGLAYEFYGTPALWYRLAIANNYVNGSMFIKPGTILIIPES